MGSRRQGREIALQALYRAELTGDTTPEAIELLWRHFETPVDARGFAIELVHGVLAERERIDQLLADAAENWSLSRLSRVDLNILRIATFEMLERHAGVPTSVVIDEAIEIARRYGGEESSQFVNGLLDQIAGRLGVRERRETPGAAEES
jgi:transcription antitermination protein NusB